MTTIARHETSERGTDADAAQSARTPGPREIAGDLRGMLDTLPDAIVRVDADLRCLELNAAAARLAGSEPSVLLGRPFDDLGPRGSAHTARNEELRDLFATTEPKTFEYEVVLGDVVRRLEVRAFLKPCMDGTPSAVVIARAITERHRAGELLAHRAAHDTLTGLADRSSLVEALELRLAHQPGAHFAVLELDVDHFKQVNDLLGHAAGDTLLVAIADRLRAMVRAGDVLARLGGDEFVVVIQRVDGAHEAAAIAGRIREVLSEPLQLEGSEVRPSVSIGIAMADGGSSTSPELLGRADAAMYVAKERGRDRQEFFDDILRTRMAVRTDLEGALRQAIDDGDLTVHYQPEIDLMTGAIQSVEALVRWPRPGHGVLSAGEFLPVAEDTGLMTELERRVLHRVTRDASEWRRRYGDRAPVVRMNLSWRELRDPVFADEVSDAIARLGNLEGFLWLEVSETTLASAPDALRGLRHLGLPISVDGFGRGSSSIAALGHLGIAALEIDRSIVARLPDSHGDVAAVGAIVALGSSLRAVVIAEGVETDAQQAVLLELSCTRGQGFLFGRAEPAEAITARLDRVHAAPV